MRTEATGVFWRSQGPFDLFLHMRQRLPIPARYITTHADGDQLYGCTSRSILHFLDDTKIDLDFVLWHPYTDGRCGGYYPEPFDSVLPGIVQSEDCLKTFQLITAVPGHEDLKVIVDRGIWVVGKSLMNDLQQSFKLCRF
jgi:hypothetical protein